MSREQYEDIPVQEQKEHENKYGAENKRNKETEKNPRRTAHLMNKRERLSFCILHVITNCFL